MDGIKKIFVDKIWYRPPSPDKKMIEKKIKAIFDSCIRNFPPVAKSDKSRIFNLTKV